MGGKDPNRQPQLAGLKVTPVGWIRMARCNHCSHMAPIPVDRLIKKHGPTMLVEFALVDVRCTVCRGAGARAVMLRLCDPECPKQRG